jgi:trigger factor
MIPMKTDLTDVSETRKNISFEVPSDLVDAEIDRVAKTYGRSAKVPGFRPGKVPTHVVKQRFRDQILYDVANDLIPKVVNDALQERGLEPVATPDIRDVVIEQGQPLTFVADFETLPPIDPGEYTGLTIRKPAAVLEVGAVEKTLEQLQQRAARWHAVEDRRSAIGDTLLLDLTRTVQPRTIQLAGEADFPAAPADAPKPEALQNVTVELGGPGNPPGFDEQLTGLSPTGTKSFTVTYPAGYEVEEMAGSTVAYDVTVKGVRRKELLPIDDDFAKEVSDVDTIEALRARIKEDLQREAEHEADHKARHELLQQLSGRVTAAPDVLVDREIEHRLEELVRRLMEQGVDPMKANIDWRQFREGQRQPAEDSVKSTLLLDEVAKREQIDANDEDVASEIERFAQRSGRTAAAVRATLEKERGLDRIRAGIRREKTMSWLLEKANVVNG